MVPPRKQPDRSRTKRNLPLLINLRTRPVIGVACGLCQHVTTDRTLQQLRFKQPLCTGISWIWRYGTVKFKFSTQKKLVFIHTCKTLRRQSAHSHTTEMKPSRLPDKTKESTVLGHLNGQQRNAIIYVRWGQKSQHPDPVIPESFCQHLASLSNTSLSTSCWSSGAHAETLGH